MIKGLADSVGTYTDRNVGEKTKQKNAQLRFAQKTRRLTKNHPDEFGVASFKMIKKCSTLFRTKNTSFNKNHPDVIP